MPLLITGGNSRLARAIVAALAETTSLRIVDTRFSDPLPEGAESREGDLRDRDFVTTALEGVDAVLHLAPISLPQTEERTALDYSTRGTYTLMTAALDAGVRRFILGSTLDLFARLPANWKVNESWRPRPEPRVDQLVPWLTELSVRECVRTAPNARALCLRFGRLVDDAEASLLPYDPRWLHSDDAVASIRSALAFEPEEDWRRQGWSIFHITSRRARAPKWAEAARTGFGYQPVHDFAEQARHAEAPAPDTRPWPEVLAPPHPIPSRPIHKVVLFGAGGPVAAAVAQELQTSYTLRRTDLRPLAQITAEENRQSPNAPLPTPLGPPHEYREVDVRDLEQVMAACEGMDAVINCTVLREDPVEAFLVNMLGAYNIVRAAAAHGIRRVVHTGPLMASASGGIGYWWDYDIPGDVPPRPGRDLYAHTKFLGQEICRVFADYYAMEVPVLLYCQFVNPEMDRWVNSFAVSWQDSARAIRRALEVPSLPSPYEVMNITADLPHGRFSNQRAKDILGWQPRDNFESIWDAARRSNEPQRSANEGE
ncbi:MAG TPA: NAD-dependent epimerase/dehydratase family protein [Chthonomonadaceae bacterium]|nr:NAD-dependent epimerase/dehydratase family protein [Chthonomonadaceae bacterium]